MWNKVSAGAAECCRVLWQAGFEAWPVGGCVRDLLLGRTPGDFDVTTDALPEQVLALFAHTVPTGVKHGTVTVVIGREGVEVTTLRGETGYSDGRHPDGVRFGVSLEEDLARRDFTVNAMALGRDGQIIDPYGGQADLKARLIRCVGQPHRRFEEDALRMLRGVRFGAQLGFALEENSEKAIYDCACKVNNLAAERVRVEVEKTLLSPRPMWAAKLFDMGLLRPWHAGTMQGLEGLDRVGSDPLDRWAALCACMDEPGQFLAALRLDGRTLRACAAGHALWQAGLPADERGWRHALAQYGPEGCRAAGCMALCRQGGEPLALLERTLGQDPCVTVDGLALSGGQLMDMGYSGPDIGRVQRALLERVLDQPGENTPQRLRQLAQELAGRPGRGEKP